MYRSRVTSGVARISFREVKNIYVHIFLRGQQGILMNAKQLSVYMQCTIHVIHSFSKEGFYQSL